MCVLFLRPSFRWVVLHVVCVRVGVVSDVLVPSVRCHIVGLHVFGVRASVLHVCGSSGGLFFMWIVLHLFGVHAVRVHLGVVNDILVHSTCGQTVGLHMFVVHVVWCSCGFSSCGPSSCELFFLLVLPILLLFTILIVYVQKVHIYTPQVHIPTRNTRQTCIKHHKVLLQHILRNKNTLETPPPHALNTNEINKHTL